MRILHVLDHSIPLHSGYTFRTRNILRQQRAMGWETLHLTGLKQGTGPADALQDDVDGLLFHRTRSPGGLVSRLAVFNQWQVITSLDRRIEEIAREQRPDIIHAHSPALNGIAALRAGRRLGIPVVYECRAFWEDAAVDHGTSREGGARYMLTRSMETRVFRKADAVTVICEGLRREIVGRGIHSGKVTVIPNAVDTDDFQYCAAPDSGLQASLGLNGRTVLGFIGSFYAYEGIPLLLECLPRLLEHDPDIRLLLVGGGPEQDRIENTISQLGLRDIVILTGRVPHARVQEYYNLVEIFAYPRLSMRLTDLVTPLKPLEAMAQGRLVVASDVGGHRELIRDGDTGVLFRAGSHTALVSAIVNLLERRDQWQEMRERAREFVTTERTWEHSVGNYRDVYGRLQGPAA